MCDGLRTNCLPSVDFDAQASIMELRARSTQLHSQHSKVMNMPPKAKRKAATKSAVKTKKSAAKKKTKAKKK
jgi:hypothetical protein